MFEFLTQSINSSADIDTGTAKYSSISDLFGAAINLMIGISIGIGIVALGYTAVQYILSAGDPKKVEQASRSLIWGVVALLVTIGALAIKTAVIAGTGVTNPDIVGDVPFTQ